MPARLRGVLFLLAALFAGSMVLRSGPPAPPVAAAQPKAPDRWSLNIPLSSQEADNWCWAASAQMAMVNFGTVTTQSEIVNAVDARTDCGQRPVPGACNHGGSSEPVLTKYGFTFTGSDKPLSQDDIVQQIFTLRKPIIFAWNWTGGGAHVMVVTGYARVGGQFMVEILDPWPPLLSDQMYPRGGAHTFVTYDRWVADTDHTFQGETYTITKALPDRWSLPVIGHAQETNNWGWAACAQMVMGSFAVQVPQSDMANFAFKRTDCAQRPVPGGCDQGGDAAAVLTKYGFAFDTSPTPLTQDQIIQQIYTLKKPFVFTWTLAGGGEKSGVVIGYARVPGGQFLLDVLDPWPPPMADARDPQGGQRGIVTYSHWAADTDHTFKSNVYNIAKKP
jgi:hypothetical protein